MYPSLAVELPVHTPQITEPRTQQCHQHGGLPPPAAVPHTAPRGRAAPSPAKSLPRAQETPRPTRPSRASRSHRPPRPSGPDPRDRAGVARPDPTLPGGAPAATGGHGPHIPSCPARPSRRAQTKRTRSTCSRKVGGGSRPLLPSLRPPVPLPRSVAPSSSRTAPRGLPPPPELGRPLRSQHSPGEANSRRCPTLPDPRCKQAGGRHRLRPSLSTIARARSASLPSRALTVGRRRGFSFPRHRPPMPSVLQ